MTTTSLSLRIINVFGVGNAHLHKDTNTKFDRLCGCLTAPCTFHFPPFVVEFFAVCVWVQMSLEEVVVIFPVLESLIAHAFTLEREECVGLLLGHLSEIPKNTGDNSTEKRFKAVVTGLYVLRRSDRRRDRVEVSSEQVAGASKYLETHVNKASLNRQQSPLTQVIGWYHSHPHITCRPSHVDLRTQKQYQQYLERSFFGIIVSTFNIDHSKRGRVELLAFQTAWTRSPLSSSTTTSPPNSETYSESRTNNVNFTTQSLQLNVARHIPKSQPITTGSVLDSGSSGPKSGQLSLSMQGLKSDSSQQSLLEIEKSTLSESLSAEYREVDIPIRLVNGWTEPESAGGSTYITSNALDMLVELQKILWEEERDSYNSSIKMRSDSHPFVCMHSAAVYQKALCRLLEYSCSPLLLLLQERRTLNQTKLAALKEEKQKLLQQEAATKVNPKP